MAITAFSDARAHRPVADVRSRHPAAERCSDLLRRTTVTVRVYVGGVGLRADRPDHFVREV